MKKVLHYKTNYLNKSETFIDRLVRNHREFEPVIMCCQKRAYTDGLTIHELTNKGVTSLINRTAFHLNRSLPWFREVIGRVKPDVIHAHFGYDSYKLLKISKILRIPLITSFYGSDVSRLPTEFDWKRRYRKLGEHGAAFIAASEFMKSQLMSLGFPGSKIRVVRFGLNLDTFFYSERNQDPSAIMMVGRLVEKKGFEYGIKAVSRLVKSGRPLKLNIYGDGPLMESLQELVMQLQSEEAIDFHGFLPVDEVIEAHHLNSVLMAPSITADDGDMEGLPNTILEAMAKGTVVIASRHAAIPEAIIDEKTGFLVNEKSVDDLVESLTSVLDRKSRADKIRKQARKMVEKDYTIQKMVSDTEDVYEEVLALFHVKQE